MNRIYILKKNKIPILSSKKKENISLNIELLALKLRGKKDKINLLILYLLFFGRLSFSYISIIMIKDIKSYFSTLKINKRRKKRVHIFPKIIKNLLFDYFIESRTNSSKYLFYDYYLQKKQLQELNILKNIF